MMLANTSLSLAASCALLSFASNSMASCENGDAKVEIRLNQVGFYAKGPKRAIVASSSAAPLAWSLGDPSGKVHASGESSVFGDDPVSGQHLHLVDFSHYRGRGQGYRITSNCAESHPFVIDREPYGELKYHALAYFYHNRSGVPVDEPWSGGKPWARPAGHERDTATCRSDVDGHGNDWPGCDYTLDLTGGWYDAGDHGKYVVNAGISVWTLLNFYERQQVLQSDETFADGHAALPEAGNGINDLLDEVRFELEFLLRMQAPSGASANVPVNVKRNAPGIFFSNIEAGGMAHHKIADENWTVLPTPPHLDEERRVLYPVSTAATLNLAAAAAQCARIWRSSDKDFAERCLRAAESAYAAAEHNPEVYFIADFSGSGMYGDSDVQDEFFWAAAELFITTGKSQYRKALQTSHHYGAAPEQEPAWPDVAPLGLISLALLPNDLPATEIAALRKRIIAAADLFRAERKRSGYHIPFAKTAYRWGSNSNVLNRAIILGLAHDFTGEDEYRNAMIDAMDYVLGRNPVDHSYVSGYGEKSMQNPHHRFWAPSFDAALPPPPPGALSGGPNSTNTGGDEVARALVAEGCAPQTCWRDDVRAFSLNEVAINWNAPLVWVAAYLDERF